MSEFHFLRPLWFVALIPALLLSLLLAVSPLLSRKGFA